MTKMQEVQDQARQLKKSLQELRSRFNSLGIELREVASKMENLGIPPYSSVQDGIRMVITEFDAQRQQTIKFAEDCSLKPEPSKLVSLNDLQALLDAAVENLLLNERERRLIALKKATAVTAAKGYHVLYLTDFRKRAGDLLDHLKGTRLEDFESELAKVQDTVDTFGMVIRIIEQGESLDDAECEKLRLTTTKIFEGPFIMAAMRGHLIIGEPILVMNNEPAPSTPPFIKSAEKPSFVSEVKTEPKEKEPVLPTSWPRLPVEPPPGVLIKKGEPIADATAFSNRCVDLERLLEKNSFHEIILQIIAQQKIGPMEFNRMSKPQVEASAQVLQNWASMTRDLKATTTDVKSVLTACGFEVTDIRQEKRHRVGFSVNCAPIKNKSICPPGYQSAATQGKYRISCYWGRPSEEMLIAEASDNKPDEIVLIFHFGCMADERRMELAKLCASDRQTLIVLDHLLLLHLVSMEKERDRLQALFASALPFSYEERLAKRSANGVMSAA
ncbi:MAG: hypothetical protein V1746_07170 [bacterium]